MRKTPRVAAATGPQRCPWTGIADAQYARYHDEEWGVPHADSRRLFEKLCLEGFQSGLSWLTILRKRDSFRRAFDGFDAERIARYGEDDVARLLADAGIVRHEGKIRAAIGNARVVAALSQRQSFAAYLWDFLDGRPIVNRHRRFADIPSETELSRRMSKALKTAGFRFVGPTTVYAFLQSSGFVNDHLVDCHRHAACSALQRTFAAPGNR